MGDQPKVIVVGNKKGGVGKSTVTIHLAGTLHRYGKKVLIIEQDTQGTVADALKMRMKYVGDPSFGYHFQTSKLIREDVLRIGAGYDFVIVDTPPGTAKDGSEESDSAHQTPGAAKAAIRPETLYSFTAADLIVIVTKLDRYDLQSVWNYMNICAGHLAHLKKAGVSPDRKAVVVPNNLETGWSYKQERRVIERQTEKCDAGRGIMCMASTPILQYRPYSKLQWAGKTAADLKNDRARYLIEKTFFEDVLSKLGVEDPRSEADKKLANKYRDQSILKIYGEVTNE